MPLVGEFRRENSTRVTERRSGWGVSVLPFHRDMNRVPLVPVLSKSLPLPLARNWTRLSACSFIQAGVSSFTKARFRLVFSFYGVVP